MIYLGLSFNAEVAWFDPPLMIWVKAFLGMGILFITVSCFSLAKTLRDQHEQQKLVNRINEAKTEKLLREVP